MADYGKPPTDPKHNAAAPTPREERLARALRANLGRRKAQSRLRPDDPPPDSQAGK